MLVLVLSHPCPLHKGSKGLKKKKTQPTGVKKCKTEPKQNKKKKKSDKPNAVSEVRDMTSMSYNGGYSPPSSARLHWLV